MRQRRGSVLRDCSLAVLIPRYGDKPQRKSIYIGTENTYTVARYKAALKRAVEMRAEAVAAYEEAATELFASLDWLEGLLGERRYVAGAQLTEADIRLFTTLLRFDPVYFGHFKCNVRRIVDYPNLREYTREIYQLPGVRETVHMDHIKGHYYQSHESINPTGIVPIGPHLDLDVPHRRG